MNRLRQIAISMLLLVLLVSVGYAQEDSSVKPLSSSTPADQQDSPSENADTQGSSRPILSPDTSPPSGAQDLTLGLLEGGNSLTGSFRFLQLGQRNPEGNGGQSWGTTTNLMGSVALERTGKMSTFKLQYTGAGFIPTNQQLGATQAQQLGISGEVSTGRWTFSLTDEAIYSPEGGYGFGGLGLAGGLGPGSQIFTGLNPSLVNQQTAFFAARRIANTSLGQITYNLSARSSITVFGSYGLLHFIDSGFIDSNQVIGQAGYNYSPTRHNTFSLSYGYARFKFGGASNSGLQSHSVNLGYTRRVTGRMVFTLSAGPQFISTQSIVSVPILQIGPFVLFGTAKENFRRLSWSGQSNLKYSMGHNRLGLSYLRAVTGGSGLLAGTQSSIAQASIERNLNRVWSGGMRAGYAHNAGLGAAAGGYNGMFAGTTVHRRMGPTAGLDFTFQLQRQTSSAGCSLCGRRSLEEIFGVGFQWKFRPVRLD